MSVVVMIAALGLTTVFTSHPAAAALVEPTEEPFPGGPPACPAGQTGFRVEAPGSGEYTDGTVFVDVTFASPTPTSGAELDFAIDFAPGKSPAGTLITQVKVKGGTPRNVYDYSGQPGGGVTADTGLHAPLNPNSGKWYDVSHIDFCYTITDPEVGGLEVVKVVDGAGAPEPGAVFTIAVDCDDDAFDETFTFDAAGDLDPAGQGNPITGIPAGTECSVTETGDGGADAVSYSPDPASVTIVADQTALVTVTNTFDAPEPDPAELTIVKETDVDTDDSFTFERSFGDDFVLGSNESQTFTDLEAGAHSVNELTSPDWTLEGIDCGDATYELVGDGVTVVLDEGDAVTCTFTNAAVEVAGEVVDDVEIPTEIGAGVILEQALEDTEVAGETLEAVESERLPFTGSSLAALVVTALLLLGAGGALVASRGRRGLA